jgi:hypothetical protein
MLSGNVRAHQDGGSLSYDDRHPAFINRRTETNQMNKVIYRVVMRSRKTSRWEPWTNYSEYNDAELAARGLITGGTATEAHILELGKGEPTIVAYIGSKTKTGWPHGQAVVRRV